VTEPRQQFARVIATLAGLAAVFAAPAAWGQGAVRDQSGTLTATSEEEAKKSWVEQKFAGSTAEVTTYVGSGTFYTSGYRDPYVSNAFFVRPQYNLGTKYKLSLAGRIYVEEEYTTPGTPNGRRFNPLDSFVYFNAKNLYTMPRAKVTFGGGLRASIPVSYESRYAHLITTLGVSANANRSFEFGRADAQGKRWNLSLTLAEGFGKALRTSAIRGNSPGDTTNCRTTGPAGAGATAGAASDDRCGGPLSTSYTFSSTGVVALSRGRYSLSASLIVLNEFKYSIDSNTYSMIDTALKQNPPQAGAQQYLAPQGRVDITWGIISAGYDITDRVSVSVGLASYQPALTSDYKSLRFPFFDFSGANANNFTELMVGVSGTL
jgi:hypothetical protein